MHMCVCTSCMHLSLRVHVSMHSHLLPGCVHVHFCELTCVCMSHSSCRYFISLLRLGGAARPGMYYDSYNLTNWDGGGFGLNLS